MVRRRVHVDSSRQLHLSREQRSTIIFPHKPLNVTILDGLFLMRMRQANCHNCHFPSDLPPPPLGNMPIGFGGSGLNVQQEI